MIKKGFVIILISLFLVSIGNIDIHAEGENPVLDNGGFEHELNKEDIQTYKAKRVDATEGKVRSGNYAIKIGADMPEEGSREYPFWLYNGGKGMVNYVIRNIKPNTKYVFKGSFYNETGVSMRIGILDLENNQQKPAGPWDPPAEWEPGMLTSEYNKHSDVSSQWEEVELELVTGPRTTELYAFALTEWTGGTPAGAGVFYVDDFSIEEKETVDPIVESTIEYTGTNENGFPFTLPMVQAFTPDESQPAFNIDKKHQLFYSDIFSKEKTEYLAKTMVEKGIINSYRIEDIGDKEPGEGIVVSQEAISFAYPDTYSKTISDAYEIDITKDKIHIHSEYLEGIQNGTMTLLQAFVQKDTLPAGQVIDYAKTDIRGLQVDSGRRYYSVDWIKNQIEQMAYQKLNTLQLRIKDNEGIRYESDVAPELVDRAGGFWTKEEVKEIVNYAKQFGIQVIPEVDLPGHSELDGEMVDESWLLAPGTKVLDITLPEVQNYMASIYEEAFTLFEADIVHMGGDEYFETPGFTDPDNKLTTWAKEETGNPNANMYDAFKLFFNKLAKPYIDNGKTVLIWNDNIKDLEGPAVTLDKNISIDFWGGGFYNSIRVNDTLSKGYTGLSSALGLYHDLWPDVNKLEKPLPKFLYSRWKVNSFPYLSDAEEVTEENMQNTLGQMFPIWDDTNGFAPEYILNRTLFPRLTIFANTMWGGDRTEQGEHKLSFKEYEFLTYKIGPLGNDNHNQIRMDYMDKDVEIIVSKIAEGISAMETINPQQDENVDVLKQSLSTVTSTTSGNGDKINTLIRLYENLGYTVPTYGNVTINYYDENGKEITDQQILTSVESIDGTYKTTPIHIEGYTFNKTLEGSASETGYFYKYSQQITYEYKKNEAPAEKTEEENNIKESEKSNTKNASKASTNDNTNINNYIIWGLIGLVCTILIYKYKIYHKD